jgi:hypothetical protein
MLWPWSISWRWRSRAPSRPTGDVSLKPDQRRPRPSQGVGASAPGVDLGAAAKPRPQARPASGASRLSQLGRPHSWRRQRHSGVERRPNLRALRLVWGDRRPDIQRGSRSCDALAPTLPHRPANVGEPG